MYELVCSRLRSVPSLARLTFSAKNVVLALWLSPAAGMVSNCLVFWTARNKGRGTSVSRHLESGLEHDLCVYMLP